MPRRFISSTSKAISCPLYYYYLLLDGGRPTAIPLRPAAYTSADKRTNLTIEQVVENRRERESERAREWPWESENRENRRTRWWCVNSVVASQWRRRWRRLHSFPSRGHTADGVPPTHPPGKRPVIVRVRMPGLAVLLCAVRVRYWYHTRFWFVVISPDELDECCVAP